MMTVKLQVVIAVLIVIGLFYILDLIRRHRLDLKYSLSWLFIGLFVLVLDAFPELMTGLAKLLGIASPVNMMFFIGFLLSLLIILTLTVVVSTLSARTKELIQEAALLEKRVRELEKGRKNAGKEEESSES